MSLALPDLRRRALRFLPGMGSVLRRAVVYLFKDGRSWGFLLLGALVLLRVFEAPVSQSLGWAPIESMRVTMFDIYQRLHPRPVGEVQVKVIDVDESSLAKLGQWPWSRRDVGRMVEIVKADGAKVVGFDLLFAELDRLSPIRFAESTPGLQADLAKALSDLPDTDSEFAQLVRKHRVVLGIAGSAADHPDRLKPAPVRLGVRDGDPRDWVYNFPGVAGNLPVLEQAAAGRGMFSVAPERDGIVRRIPAIARSGDNVYPTLSIEMLRVASKAPALLVRMDRFQEVTRGVKDVVLQGARIVIPTDSLGRLWPHYAPMNRDRYVSALDVLERTFPPGTFKDKLVLVGTSAEGLRDIRSTPLESAVPGVEVHAQLLESMVTDALVSRPPAADGLELDLTMAAGLLTILGMAVVGARGTVLVVLGVIAAAFTLSFWYFTEQRLLVDAAYPSVTAFLIYLMLTYIRFTSEEASKRYIKSTFGFFLSPALVDKLANDPSQMKLGGESKDLTIMFSDVRGFTSISEVMTAEQLTNFMNRYLTAMTDIAQDEGAYIDKYIGDAIMAFWNAPLNDPEHANSACRTILRMRERLAPLNEELRGEFEPLFTARGKKYPGIAIGMGLNTGFCVVGNMGSNQKFNYSVLGDTVNLASRLEGQTKGYGLDNIIGENTFAEAPDYAAVEVDSIRVKGKLDAVRIYTLVGAPDLASTPDFRQFRTQHAPMLERYRSQDWDGAQAMLDANRPLAERFGLAKLYHVYDDRIAEYRANPPPADWDGVYTATSK